MSNIYWSINSWGDSLPPINADKIIATANELIDEYAESNPDASEEELHDYANALWDDFCQTDTIAEVAAEYGVLLNGNVVKFDVCAHYMDDEIREELAAEGIENEQEFLDRYVELHAAKYDGEEFELP